jgi:hypothetical protein
MSIVEIRMWQMHQVPELVELPDVKEFTDLRQYSPVS